MTSLQVHQSIHLPNESFVDCNICFKRFFNHRSLERHQKIHKNVKFKCTLCEKAVSNRKDNIRRHIRHLHTDIDRSDISNNITMVQVTESSPKKNADEQVTDGNEESLPDDLESSEPSSLFVEPSESSIDEPPPPIDNRVKVIQSIGNPNKYHELEPTLVIEDLEIVIQLNSDKTKQPELLPLLEAQNIETELKLPPKEKTIALSQPSTSSPQTTKPKYDPIQHYRKILLGFSKDDDHPISDDNIIEDEDVGQETQVFPVHWRKRTSQNFLFRR